MRFWKGCILDRGQPLKSLPNSPTPTVESQVESSPPTCVICDAAMVAWLDNEFWRCEHCSHWSSRLHHSPLKESILELDEAQRQCSLRELRRTNARLIVKEISSRVDSKHPTLCDVGTAYGWFLESAQSAGIESLGIEPEVAVAESAIQNGLAVRVGKFPACLASTEQFDVLTFNDVFEHLADPVQVLEACRRHLRPRGLLVLVLPSSDGFLFRLARVLRWLGIRKPWDRLWQRSFPCPHVHYYSPHGLKTLLLKRGFQLEYASDLPSFHYRGLWNRIRMESNISFTRASMSYLLLIGLSPIVRLARSDISLQIYRSGG